MRVDRHVPGGAAQGLLFPVRDVLLGPGVPVPLGHAEIHHVHLVLVGHAPAADQEVVRLDVPVYEIVLVHPLDQRDHLHRNLHHRLHRELPAAPVEEVLQRRAEQVDHEDVVQPLLPEVVGRRNALDSDEMHVCSVLVPELWCLCLAWLELDRHRDPVDEVCALEDHPKRPFTDLFPDLVVEPHHLTPVVRPVRRRISAVRTLLHPVRALRRLLRLLLLLMLHLLHVYSRLWL